MAKISRKFTLKAFMGLLLAIALVPIFYIGWKYYEVSKIPRSRLPLDQFYPGMPPNESRYYIELPVDHKTPNLGNYKGFYFLSPNFKKNGNVIFFLTDGQQTMVRPKGNSKFIEYQLPGFSYVTIGRRGHSPTLFPEVYNEDGSTNLKMAMQLYGSEQHIEDINCIRLDLIKKGYLKKNQKIMLFGGSGAGFLVQQFLSKYGEFVSKALIYVSGAPDIAQKKGIMEFNIFKDYNPEAFKLMKSLKLTDSSSISKLCSILYDIGRRNYEPKKKQIEFLREVTTDQYLKNLKYWINPRYSPWFMDKTLQLPFGCCIKVRLYELYGNAQKKYLKRTTDEICLALESISYVLRDLIKAEKDGIIELPSFNINRSSFSGQMLVVSGSKDVAFTSEIGELVAKSYSNSKFALFDDGHSMFLDPKFHFALKKAFFEGGFDSEDFQKLFRCKLIVQKWQSSEQN